MQFDILLFFLYLYIEYDREGAYWVLYTIYKTLSYPQLQLPQIYLVLGLEISHLYKHKTNFLFYFPHFGFTLALQSLYYCLHFKLYPKENGLKKIILLLFLYYVLKLMVQLRCDQFEFTVSLAGGGKNLEAKGKNCSSKFHFHLICNF